MAGDDDPGSDSDDQLIQLDGDFLNEERLLDEPRSRSRARKKHFFWVRWICQRPKTMFAITAMFHVSVVIVSVVLFLTGYDIIHLVVKGFPVYDMHDVMYQRFLAWSRKESNSNFYIKVKDMYPERKRRSLPDPTSMHSHNNLDSGVFRQFSANIDPTVHQTQAELEHLGIYSDWMSKDSFSPFFSPSEPYTPARWKSSVQLSVLPKSISNSNLKPTRHRTKRSSVRYCPHLMYIRLDMIYDIKDGNIFSERYMKKIQEFESVLTGEFDSNVYGNYTVCYCPDSGKGSVFNVFEKNFTAIKKDRLSDIYYLGKEGKVDEETRIPRSRITRSYLRFCTNGTWEKLLSWGNQIFFRRADELGDVILKPAGISLSYFEFNVYTDRVFTSVVHRDIFLFCGSVSFIFVFMWLQTGSLWITSFGIISILTSILAANLIYNCLIGYKYLSIFNLLSLFVVLGIGADDIFIFVDTWKWLEGKFETQEERITQCFKKAGVAMFSTSLTTMVAFFVSSFSTLLALSSFGTLSGLVVLVNYISVMIFFPTVILAHENIFGKAARGRRCCTTIRLFFSRKETCMVRIHGRIVSFFGDTFYRVITSRIGKWIIIVAFVAFTAGMSYSITDLKVEDKATSPILRTGSPFEQGRMKATDEFKQNGNDLKAKVFLVWGFKPRDMSPCNKHRYDYMKPCPGKEALDDHFHLEDPDQQMAMLNLCREIHDASPGQIEELALDVDSNTNKVKVNCVLEAFNIYLNKMSNKLGVNISMPLTKAKLKPIIPLLKFTGQADIDLDAMHTPFQTMLWIFLEKSGFAGQIRLLAGFKPVMGSEMNNSVGTYNGDALYNRHLRYIGMYIPTNRSVMTLGIDEGIKLMNSWEDFAKEKVSHLPDGLKGGFQVSQVWFLINMKERLVMNAVIGVGVSLGLGFTLLLITTRNIILAGISLVTLSATVACVVGVMPIMNWKLGALVALNMCFVAGLAVDYIVHVIEGFQLSDYTSRHDRIQECLRHVGISVISGAVTTLGSSFFMLFAQINFFMQFGWFIFCTIGLSLVFSLFFLPALLSIIGPSGNQGSITAVCKRRKQIASRSYISL